MIHSAPSTSAYNASLAEIAPKFDKSLRFGGIVLLLIAFVLGLGLDDNLNYFLHAYLQNYAFFLTITLGALFFVIVSHLTRAGWNVALRRVVELISANFPMLALLFLPIFASVLFGNDSLYMWVDTDLVEKDPLLLGKAPYLNVSFFSVRVVLYFGIWIYLSRFFFTRSLEQDVSGDPNLTVQCEKISAPAMLLFAMSLTFAAFDWLMGLDARWYSTMFGVYIFAGCAVSMLATVILVLYALQSSGRLVGAVSVEHFHDLGKLLFGFVAFWGYVTFSQYMLIWYANIPEETTFYALRQQHGWPIIGLLLVFGGLVIPLLGLISRHVKRNPFGLCFWAVWLLVMHWIDLYYVVMPSLGADSLPFGAIDLCCLFGIGALVASGVLGLAGDVSLVPQKDPRLAESLAFKNV